MAKIRRADLVLQQPEMVTAEVPGLGPEPVEVDVRPLRLADKLRLATFEPVLGPDGTPDVNDPANNFALRCMAETIVDADGERLMTVEQWEIWSTAQPTEVVTRLASLALDAAGAGGGAKKK